MTKATERRAVTAEQIRLLRGLFGSKTNVIRIAVQMLYNHHFAFSPEPKVTKEYLEQWLDNLRKWFGNEVVADCEPGKTILGGKP